jgi:radical SAM PhpK family P-methyltransferase
MTDCLLIGFNDRDFDAFCSNIHALGERSPAWRDVRTSVVFYNGEYLRALDVLTAFQKRTPDTVPELLHNMDFLSPAILYLGSFIKERGFSFDYINLFHYQKEQLREKLHAGDVRSVVITTTLYVTPEPIQEVVTWVRQCDPTIKILIGGPYILKETIDANPDDVQRLFKYLDGDFYVMSSEGEQTLCRILAALKSDGAFADIPNCAYRVGGTYVVNPLAPEENMLENTVIDYSAFPRNELGEFVSIRTALSCPFSCAFCGFPQRAGRHRAADLNHVERELDALHNLGSISTITFLDDSFNVPRSRFKEILQMMIRKRYGFTWNSFLRCDHVDAEIIDLMKEAGCEGVFIGAESGNDKMLQRMNKTVRRHHFIETVPLFKKAGIVSHMSLIIGFPGETEDSVRDTISLVEESQPDFFRAQLWYCDPMTPIWQKRDQFSIKGAGFSWSHDSMTSEVAMDWVEEMYMSVSRSIWLPQHGFELWSVFYLQRKGMSLAQVKAFLACFNAAVKEQVITCNSLDLHKKTGGNLQAASISGTGTLPYPEALWMGSGDHYRRAETFWKQVIPILQPLSPADVERPVSGWEMSQSIPIITMDAFESAARQINVDGQILALSLFTAIVSRVYGNFEVPVAVEWESVPHFPLSLTVRWEESFRDHIDATNTAVGVAVTYVDYLKYFLDSPFHAWADREALALVYAGFSMAKNESYDETNSTLWQNLPLQLNLQASDGSRYLTLNVAESFITAAAAHDVVRFFNQALTEITENPDRVTGSLLASEKQSNSNEADVEEGVEFQF